jgi:hypothetical protein
MVLARGISRITATPGLLSLLLTNPDGSSCQLPCMFGARPGVMTPDQMLRVLRRHPVTRDFSQRTSADGSTVWLDGEAIRLTLDYTGTWIALSVKIGVRHAPQLGDTIAAFGQPDFVSILKNVKNKYFAVHYVALKFKFEYETSWRSRTVPGFELLSIILNADIPDIAMRQAYFRSELFTPWRGFTWMKRYTTS